MDVTQNPLTGWFTAPGVENHYVQHTNLYYTRWKISYTILSVLYPMHIVVADWSAGLPALSLLLRGTCALAAILALVALLITARWLKHSTPSRVEYGVVSVAFFIVFMEMANFCIYHANSYGNRFIVLYLALCLHLRVRFILLIPGTVLMLPVYIVFSFFEPEGSMHLRVARGLMVPAAIVACLCVTRMLDKVRRREFVLLQQTLSHEKKLRERTAKTIALLRSTLPRRVIVALTAGRSVERIVPGATVIFTDIVGFTKWSSMRTATDVTSYLNLLFTEFDVIVGEHNIEKIKTIGDAYWAVAGLFPPNNRDMDDHAVVAADASMEFLCAVEQMNSSHNSDIEIRVGMASGPVMAGVVGKLRMTFEVWGTTNQIAAHMESSGEPSRVQVSESTCKLLKMDYMCEPRAPVIIPDVGAVTPYLLGPRLSSNGDGQPSPEIVPRTPGIGTPAGLLPAFQNFDHQSVKSGSTLSVDARSERRPQAMTLEEKVKHKMAVYTRHMEDVYIAEENNLDDVEEPAPRELNMTNFETDDTFDVRATLTCTCLTVKRFRFADDQQEKRFHEYRLNNSLHFVWVAGIVSVVLQIASYVAVSVSLWGVSIQTYVVFYVWTTTTVLGTFVQLILSWKLRSKSQQSEPITRLHRVWDISLFVNAISCLWLAVWIGAIPYDPPPQLFDPINIVLGVVSLLVLTVPVMMTTIDVRWRLLWITGAFVVCYVISFLLNVTAFFANILEFVLGTFFAVLNAFVATSFFDNEVRRHFLYMDRIKEVTTEAESEKAVALKLADLLFPKFVLPPLLQSLDTDDERTAIRQLHSISECIPSSCVMFVMFGGIDQLASLNHPRDYLLVLNTLYNDIDDIIANKFPNLTKIKNIGPILLIASDMPSGITTEESFIDIQRATSHHQVALEMPRSRQIGDSSSDGSTETDVRNVSLPRQPSTTTTHNATSLSCTDCLRLSVQIREYISKFKLQHRRLGEIIHNWNIIDVSVKIGLAQGPITGAIIGTSKFLWDTFGDTVNTASRMASTSPNNTISVTPSVLSSLNPGFRGQFDETRRVVKGKGELLVYTM